MSQTIDRPIPFTVTDLPIPYRVRVAAPSAELRGFVAPRHDVQTFTSPPVPGDLARGVSLSAEPARLRVA